MNTAAEPQSGDATQVTQADAGETEHCCTAPGQTVCRHVKVRASAELNELQPYQTAEWSQVLPVAHIQLQHTQARSQGGKGALQASSLYAPPETHAGQAGVVQHGHGPHRGATPHLCSHSALRDMSSFSDTLELPASPSALANSGLKFAQIRGSASSGARPVPELCSRVGDLKYREC